MISRDYASLDLADSDIDVNYFNNRLFVVVVSSSVALQISLQPASK